MGSRVRGALLGVSLGFFLGCSGGETLWLLELSGLENGVLEPGESLEFSGRGFPSGRTGEVLLRGELLTPGAAPRSIAWSLRSEARSGERVSAFLDAEGLREVQGHVSFTGTATLRFAVHDRLAVAGQLKQVSIEWAGEDRLDTARLADAVHTLESVGIVAADSDSDSSVLVTAVAAGSAAARSGVTAGDTIRHANGFPVRSVSDVAQHPAAERLRLSLRDSQGFVRSVELHLSHGQGLATTGLRFLLWACPVALALLFLGPWPRPLEMLRAGLAHVQARPISLFRVSDASSQVTPASVVTSAAVCSLLVWQAPRVSLTAALALYASLLFLRSSGFSHTAPSALLSFAMLCTAALSGGTGLATLAADQGAWPWGWNLFSRPPVWLSVFVWWHCAARLHDGTTRSRAPAWLDDASRVLLAALTASVFLGGPGGADVNWSPALESGLNSALFAVKTLAVLWVLAVLPPLAATRLRVIAGTLLASAASTGVWLWLMPSRTFELRVGMTVLATLVLVALAASLDYAWRRRRTTTAVTQ